jgi:hypothetical protein
VSSGSDCRFATLSFEDETVLVHPSGSEVAGELVIEQTKAHDLDGKAPRFNVPGRPLSRLVEGQECEL